MNHEERIAEIEKNVRDLANLLGRLTGLTESSNAQMEMLLSIIEKTSHTEGLLSALEKSRAL